MTVISSLGSQFFTTPARYCAARSERQHGPAYTTSILKRTYPLVGFEPQPIERSLVEHSVRKRREDRKARDRPGIGAARLHDDLYRNEHVLKRRPSRADVGRSI